VKLSWTEPLCRQKRGLAVGKTKRGKGTKIMGIADATGFPVSAHIESASPHEVKLVEATIESGFTQYAPDRIIGDKAYDSDGLDERLLEERGIEVIAPHRESLRKQCSQDDRKLRRYKRLWKVERLFAWLQNFRRLVVRYEYHAENFLGLVSSVVPLYYFVYFEMASNRLQKLLKLYLQSNKKVP
jgi:transposase